MKRPLLVLAGIAISVVALALVVATIDVGRAIDLLRTADIRPLLVIPLLVGLQLAIRTFRWQALTRVATGRLDVPFWPTLRALLVGYLANVVLPARLGELVRTAILARRLEVAPEPVLGTVVVERVLDVATLGVAGAIGVGLTLGLASALGAAALTAAAIGVGVILAMVFGARVLAPRLETAGPSTGLLARALASLRALLQGLAAIPVRTLALAAGICFATWLIDATSFVLVARAVGVDLPFAAGLVFAAATVLGTALPSAPGYIGVFEATGTAAGIALGLESEVAFAITLLAHVILVGIAALNGAVALIVEGSAGRSALSQTTSR